MPLRKIAFNLTEHMKICEAILGESFNEVHTYMEGRGGGEHREKHEHNKEAEQEIREKFGEKGVEAFLLHLICDDIHRTYLQDKIIPEVKRRFEEIKSNQSTSPYFEKRKGWHCQEIFKQVCGADLNAKITTILDKCKSCGNTENLLIYNTNAICKDCSERKGLVIRATCHKPVASNCAVPDKIDNCHFICKLGLSPSFVSGVILRFFI
jgi:hypothetical protein